MRIDQSSSPCRPHPCSREHADVVHTFRDLAREWEDRLEREARGYATEMAEFERDNPRPRFRNYLIMTRRPVDA
jgi:hypothetical protein